jgi:hypothetical protein
MPAPLPIPATADDFSANLPARMDLDMPWHARRGFLLGRAAFDADGRLRLESAGGPLARALLGGAIARLLLDAAKEGHAREGELDEIVGLLAAHDGRRPRGCPPDVPVEWITAAIAIAVASEEASATLRSGIHGAGHRLLGALQRSASGPAPAAGAANASLWHEDSRPVAWEQGFEDLHLQLYDLGAEVGAAPTKALLESFILGKELSEQALPGRKAPML